MRGLALLLTVFAAWGAWFILRTSFLLEGERVFCLFDDAMISMTYARNWVEGFGLNWAREGAPVEGFSCPLWTFYMALLHLLPVPLRFQSLLVQGSSLLLLAANVAAVFQLVRRHFSCERAAHALPAAILTATYYPLALWSLQGMESGLQALLLTLAVLLASDIAFAGRRREAALFAMLAAAVLLRLDMLLPVAAVCAFGLLHGGLEAPRLRRWLAGCAFVAAALLAYQVFRWLYFHDWLPNTYYLKMTGLPASTRILRGWIVFQDFLRIAAIPLALALLGGAALARRRPAYRLPLALVTLQLGYSIWVGGDAWEWSNVGANRFQVVVMPLAFALLGGLLNAAIDTLRRRRPGLRLGPGDAFALLPASLACLLLANGLVGVERAGERWRNLLVLDPPLHVDLHRETLQKLRLLQRHFEPEARMLTVLAGIPAYFSDFRMADTLGYNDRHIARLEHVHRLRVLDPTQLFKPGHNKLSYAYSLGTLRPDFVFQTFWLGPREPELMEWYGYERRYGVWVRRDTPYSREPAQR
jgi:hypothetical protein